MTIHERNFDVLAFDLDDTLLDTYRLLVPRASRDASLAMIEAGLNASLSQALSVWEEHGRTHPRREVFSFLVEHFGVREGANPQATAQRGYHCFYTRRVETDITLFEGAQALLTGLQRDGYSLHLVTSGSRATQEEKIKILGLRPYFESISHVDPTRGELKGNAFATIMRNMTSDHVPPQQISPQRFLSVGNRIDTDIGEARAIGWKACWVRYGEHVSLEPQSATEQPDFVISHIRELRETCHL